ncbi:MAG: peptidase dimerization domain-containing protein, partial [Deltaproteobacteria bacterium]
SISEVGGFSMEMEGVRFYLIQVAEKGMCWLKVRTEGEPGHGSIPNQDSALIRAAEIAEKLGRNRLPQHNVDAMIRFVNLLSSHLRFPKSLVFKMLLNPTFSNFILDKVFPDKGVAQTFAAMIHNTANPTVIHAGEKTNVIPSVAELEVDGRLLPGYTSEDFIAEVRSLIGEEPEIEVIRKLTPTEAPADDAIMDLIREVVLKHDPGTVVIPNLVTAFTDATHWKKLGIKCYGFVPLKLPSDISFRNMFHGHEVLFEMVEKLIT